MGKKSRLKKRNVKYSIILLIAFIALALGYRYYQVQKDSHTFLLAHFENSSAYQTNKFNLEIVKKPKDLQKGLMFVKKLDPNKGMIFVFPTTKIQTMWMKNTYVSLDMLFLDEAFKIVGILENVPTLNTKTRKVDKDSKYVIEIASGGVAREKIEVGMKLKGDLSKLSQKKP